jgi:2-keto-3-deoxy-6-phosphogluconate aldolase
MRGEPGRPLSKTELAEAIKGIGIIATVQLPSEQHLLRVGTALLGGGVRAVELSFTTMRSAPDLRSKNSRRGGYSSVQEP